MYKKMKNFKKITLILAILITFLIIFVNFFNFSLIANAYEVISSSATSMCVLDETGRILYEKNKDEKRANASTTKIVTAITVLEHIEDLDKLVKISDMAIGIEGTSIYLRRGEELTIRDLLYGLMLRSGNDSAVALAIETAGSVEAFADMMNETAIKAGATNSHFTNPHGLDDENHYTTAYDLSKIAMYALNNETFKEIVSTKSYQIKATEQSDTRYLKNKNKLLSSLDGCIGVKTGYTSKAGRCLVSAREIGGRKVVCTVLNCGPMFEESKALLEASFVDYKSEKLLSKEKVIKKDNYYMRIKEDKYYTLTEDELNDVTYKYTFYDTTKSYKDSENVGIVEVYLKNDLIISSKLFNISRIDALNNTSENNSIVLQWEEKYEDQ